MRIEGLSSTVLLPVFLPAVLVTALLVIGTLSNPQLASEAFSSLLAFITQTFGWFYMLTVAVFMLFIVGVAFSSWGNIKLGPDHSEPQYGFPAWFAMLFSAGYGIALLFFGVAEPVLHYAEPPAGAAQTVDAARQAMQIAFFHWGFHIWAIYGVTGLILAYFAFRHGLPLSIRSAFYPLIGERIYGPIGHVVDVFAILGTLFGVATTLGLSVTQLNTGLNYLWPQIPVGTGVQLLCIGLITGLAIWSVVSGMDKGVKRLSELNMVLVLLLLSAVFLAGPSIHILEAFLQNTGSYLNHIVERTFNLQAYSRSDWIGNWTLFIFGWTIAWAPFVGLFIARISRGRTIRQFIVGVMLVPTLFTFLWFSVFGDTALHLIMQEGVTTIISDVQQDTAVALFRLYEQLPFSWLLSLLTVILIVTFFVTSSDSASLVIDSLASGGSPVTPVWQRVFWASTEGILAAGLLLAGGLSSLQTMAIASALPFAMILLVAVFCLWRALVIEGHRQHSLAGHIPGYANGSAWKKRLARVVQYPDKPQAQHDLATACLAMQHLADEMRQEGWQTRHEQDAQQGFSRLSISSNKDDISFFYEVRLCRYPRPDFALPDAMRLTEEQRCYYRAEVFLRRGGQGYDVFGYDEAELIGDILGQFESYLLFRHRSPGNLPWDMARTNSEYS